MEDEGSEYFRVHHDANALVCPNQRAVTNPQDADYLFIHVGIYHGGHLLAEEYSDFFKATSSVLNHTIQFKRLMTCNIPRGSRVCFTVYHRPDAGVILPGAYVID
jgi:hypothetical protein